MFDASTNYSGGLGHSPLHLLGLLHSYGHHIQAHTRTTPRCAVYSIFTDVTGCVALPPTPWLREAIT